MHCYDYFYNFVSCTFPDQLQKAEATTQEVKQQILTLRGRKHNLLQLNAPVICNYANFMNLFL